MPIFCQPVAWSGQLSGSLGGAVRAAADLTEAARLLEEDPAETLVVVGPETDAEQALAFSSMCRFDRPSVGVVLVRHHIDVTLLTNALRAGVREVVQAGDVRALSEACVRSRELSLQVATGPIEPVEDSRDGRVVTVFSAKGGCGKTTLAVNLAVAMATAGGRRVCLVDLDLAFGDVAITMQLDPVRTMVHGVPMAGHLDTMGASSLLTPYRPGLDTLLAPVAPGDAEKIPAALVGELLAVLRRMYDFVVVDTPSQFSEHVLAAMDASQHHVLLTTPDVPALKNLRVTLDMLDLLSYPGESRAIVLNRADSKVGLTQQDVDRVVRSPLLARVPSSRDVPVSTNKGTPITLATPAHPVSEAIIAFARQYLLQEQARPSQGGLARLRMRRRSA